MGAITSIPARANEGGGTEELAFEVIDSKFVAPVRSVDDAGVGSQVATEAGIQALAALLTSMLGAKYDHNSAFSDGSPAFSFSASAETVTQHWSQMVT